MPRRTSSRRHSDAARRLRPGAMRSLSSSAITVITCCCPAAGSVRLGYPSHPDRNRSTARAALAYRVHAGAQVRINAPQLETAIQILSGYDAGLQCGIDLEVGETLEKDAAFGDRAELCRTQIGSQRIDRISHAMT